MERITEGRTGCSRGDLLLQITHGARPEDEKREVVIFLCEGEDSIWTLVKDEFDDTTEREILGKTYEEIKEQKYPERMEDAIIRTIKGRTDYETELGYPVEFETPKKVRVRALFDQEFSVFGNSEKHLRKVALFHMNEYLKTYGKVENDSLFDIDIDPPL